MWIRSSLGALDVNCNAGRRQATTADGLLRWRIKVDRAGKEFTAQPVKQEKCDQWKRDIVELVCFKASSNYWIYNNICKEIWLLYFHCAQNTSACFLEFNLP